MITLTQREKALLVTARTNNDPSQRISQRGLAVISGLGGAAYIAASIVTHTYTSQTFLMTVIFFAACWDMIQKQNIYALMDKLSRACISEESLSVQEIKLIQDRRSRLQGLMLIAIVISTIATLIAGRLLI